MGTFLLLGGLALAFIGAAVLGHWLTHEEDVTADGGGTISGSAYFGGADDAGDAGDL